MKIVFNIKEDDARNPGVIGRLHRRQRRRLSGTDGDGFETYGVTGVALIAFILVGVKSPIVQVQLLVWIFVMADPHDLTSGASYVVNATLSRAPLRRRRPDELRGALTRSSG